jgi:threonine/homoserine/homoserine lactone efflux protein
MAFWEGVLAGYGIAIPVGAIAILIIDVALRQGFASGFMAGAGAATVDLIYATVAVLAGVALLSYLTPYATVLQVTSSIVLIGLGSYGLLRVRRRRSEQMAGASVDGNQNHFRIYAKFFGLTLLNPLTIAYFGALILGRNLQSDWTTADRLLFIVGAGLASLSWQTFLAAFGSVGRSRLSSKVREIVSIVGNIIVIGLGVRIALQLLG